MVRLGEMRGFGELAELPSRIAYFDKSDGSFYHFQGFLKNIRSKTGKKFREDLFTLTKTSKKFREWIVLFNIASLIHYSPVLTYIVVRFGEANHSYHNIN